EPLLTFKRGALVHFAVSQYEVYMATRLEGNDTYFLPFNKGTADGGAGNDVPEDINQYATDYLWNEVLLPDNLLNILARSVHLEIEEKEDWEGRKYKRSEEHTSELQSRENLVCRLLLEKKTANEH